MFKRIQNGTTTFVDAFVLKLVLFVTFVIGIGIGAGIYSFLH